MSCLGLKCYQGDSLTWEARGFYCPLQTCFCCKVVDITYTFILSYVTFDHDELVIYSMVMHNETSKTRVRLNNSQDKQTILRIRNATKI